MRIFGLCAVLLLGGCLEAVDLAEERLVSRNYCETTPGTVTLCPDKKD